MRFLRYAAALLQADGFGLDTLDLTRLSLSWRNLAKVPT